MCITLITSVKRPLSEKGGIFTGSGEQEEDIVGRSLFNLPHALWTVFMTPLLEFRCCYLLRLWRYLTSMQQTHRYLSAGILALDQVQHLNSALLQAVGGHKGTLLREWSEARHWAWPIAQLLSLTPMVPDCSRVSPIHALLAVRQFFLLAPVLLTVSHWPGTSSSSFSFPSLCLTWSTLHSHSLRWIPGCLPPGTFVLQIVVGRALLTVTRSSGIPNHKCPNPHSSSPSSSLCCLLPRS